MPFEPIAIVGQACTLPGAHTPRELWENIAAKRSLLSAVPDDRWGIRKATAMGSVTSSTDRTWSDVGGYVRGFEQRFDPTGFALPCDELAGLDPLFLWVMHGGREALRTAGHSPWESADPRAGLVLGNLSFPSSSMAAYAESIWFERAGLPPRASAPDPRNRFMSGLPAHLAAAALGLGAGAFALDAACASSLYAIKLACDRLHDRTADVMVAGAVNRADDLFIHIGFCALSAMSKTGQSRPFHRDADGLVPSEGAGFVVLERLSDAVAAKKPILGVIRGVGLSNDGRGRGFLAPSEEGQERAMRLAYAEAGLSPQDISLVECHATGTTVGDTTELRSMGRVFEGASRVPIGSLKSNLGHLVTVAGVAAVIKVLGAFEHGTRPATINADAPLPGLQESPFRLLTEAERWDGPKRAAISAFGFGGNNAHLILEEWDGRSAAAATSLRPRVPAQAEERIAIVSVGARVGHGESARDFTDALLRGAKDNEPRATVLVTTAGLRTPPLDLKQTLAQQTLILEAAREAARGVLLPRDRTSVLVGMICDAEIARYGARWRLEESVGGADSAWVSEAKSAFQGELQAAGVVGTMPNIVANRISSQLDLAGPGFSVSAEEASGTTALSLAARALRAKEIDAALVGAVDLSHELVHNTALGALGRTAPPGDAAIVLVLKREGDALRDGDAVYAILGEPDAATAEPVAGRWSPDLTAQFGKAHAASGLVHVAAAAIALRHGAQLHEGRAATPASGSRELTVRTPVLGAADSCTTLQTVSRKPTRAAWASAAPRLYVYSGRDRDDAIAAMMADRTGTAGAARIVLVAADEAERSARADGARKWLLSGGPPPEGVAWRAKPIEGEVAFVFTGAAASYPGMGGELSLALPGVVDALHARCTELQSSTDWLYGAGAGTPTHPLDQLWGASYVSQLHAELSQRVLGITPSVAIGYSSGESNSLFAMGVWNDLDAMIRESRTSTVFTSDLVGSFDAPKRAWKKMTGAAGGSWANYGVAASPDDVRAALRDEPCVHLTIINTDQDCAIGGEAAACERVIDRLGRARAVPLTYEMAAHTPEVEEIRDAWWKMHHRAATSVSNVRFYTNATGAAYTPTSDHAADAITGQAVRTLDFRRVILQAYADGARVFIEHGPRDLCSRWIRSILGDREHMTVPLDVFGRNGVRQAMNAAAWLVAAGVETTHEKLESLLEAASPRREARGATLTFPAHPPVPTLPSVSRATPRPPARTVLPDERETESVMQEMPRAPRLPSVLNADTDRAPFAAAPVQHASHVPLEEPALLPMSARPEVDVMLSGPAVELAAHYAQISEIHRAFLAQQDALHQRFLALRHSAERGLLEAYGARGDSVYSAAPAATAPTTAEVAFEEPHVPSAHLAVPAPLPASPPSAPRPLAQRSGELPGPKFDRKALEVLAGGSISSVFGELFAQQDQFARQVRMPQPPLLLADRVTGIDAVAGSMGKGTLWTETDVRQDSWYLNDEGRMPAGIMIESGQADLLLISWLGVDLLNRGERVYRLLGCELTYHGALPVPGETLVYDIHIDGHAKQGDVRLFFFHYDCHIGASPRLSVRNGQAGFFTDEELANSGGVLWDAETERPTESPVDAPLVACTKQAFNREEVREFAAGNPFACFGRGWEVTQAHVRTPRITGGRMLFLEEVTGFSPDGGPWGRGYLRAETKVTPNDWFFKGHFKNDPCMPGTLMFEGCLQAMAFYLAALGYTKDRDGWRFEPVPEEKYVMRCRGQVTPTSKHLVYEVFISHVSAGPIPTIFADLLCTVDGRKAFHARRVGLRLVPDFPLDTWKALGPATTQETSAPVALCQLGGLVGYQEKKPVAQVDGFAFDYASLLACAWGRPSTAFGPFYKEFDGTRRVARLPGPPYHFMSRVTKLDAPMGGMKSGSTIEVEYDIPRTQWYFSENGTETMPFCVLMEAALQPCGWLASYVGSALTSSTDLLFRNLDGTGTLHEELVPTSGTLTTRVTLTSISQTAGMIIQSFVVACTIEGRPVYEMKTVFGFFPKEAFLNQVGLPFTPEEQNRLTAKSDTLIDLTKRPARFCEGELCLPGPMLLMLDRITDLQPTGGRLGLGYARAEKTVRPSEWFFKAHFFQDPVQPGSLGVDAMCQLLQAYMIEKGMGAGIAHPRFLPLLLERPVTWKYRGQVVPENGTITTEIEITEVGEDESGRFVVAEAWLWVDGKRIYHAKNLGMRVAPGEPRAPKALTKPTASGTILDPGVDLWLTDHCPTWTLPALPLMSMVDMLAGAATRVQSRRVTSLSDVQVKRWLPFPDGAVELRTETGAPPPDSSAVDVTLTAFRKAADDRLSRFEPVATGRVSFDDQDAPPPRFAPLRDAATVEDPYESAQLFHGPAFQYVTALSLGHEGASATLDAGKGTVPYGTLHQGLLDALTHAIPHDHFSIWSSEISDDLVAYPYRIKTLRLYRDLPRAGIVTVETRFAGFDGSARFPQVDIQLIDHEGVIATCRLVEILLPKGPLGAPPADDRRAFLRDGRFLAGIGLSREDDGTTVLSEASYKQTDWLPGNLARIYSVPSGRDVRTEIAVKEHVARRAFVHPMTVGVENADGSTRSARAMARPLRLHTVTVTSNSEKTIVVDRGRPVQDLAPVREYWRERIGIGAWPIEDLYFGLIQRFVGDVVLSDPAAFAKVRGRSCLYLANHQVGIESLLFSVIVSALSQVNTATLAKAEHKTSWMGTLINESFAYPGVTDPKLITFFDRDDKDSLLTILGGIASEMKPGSTSDAKSTLVHVEGTRSLAARQPVTKLTSTFIDMALRVGAPIVPVRFTSGLPVEPLLTRIDFPFGFGKQDYWLGRPILPEELATLPYKERRDFVMAAINTLGPSLEEELPTAPNLEFGARVEEWMSRTGTSVDSAVLMTTLLSADPGCPDVQELVKATRTGSLRLSDDARGTWMRAFATRLFGPRGPKITSG